MDGEYARMTYILSQTKECFQYKNKPKAFKLTFFWHLFYCSCFMLCTLFLVLASLDSICFRKPKIGDINSTWYS